MQVRAIVRLFAATMLPCAVRSLRTASGFLVLNQRQGQLRVLSSSSSSSSSSRARPRPLMALKNHRGPLKPQIQELPPMNEQIKAPQLRVIIDGGDQPDEPLGVISRAEALDRANELGVDLVLIADKSDPPVCKIVNYGKLRYAKEKKKKEQAKKARSNEIKEVKMSYKIGEADYQVRRRNASKFISAGQRVKVFIQFRGREQQHINLGEDLIDRLMTDLADDGHAVMKSKVLREGRDLTTIVNVKS